MTSCISLINCKGGTSKTTSVINLAHALGNKKLKILICDLDPQASASLSLGFRSADTTIADVLLEKYPVNKAIKKTTIEGVDILTGSMALASFDVTFANSKGREHKIKEMLNQVKGYDVILLDCPPTLGLLALNAITASTEFIVPVIPQYLALEGLSTFTDALERIKSGIGCKASMMGILLTQVDRRSKASKEIIGLMRKHYTDKVFKTEIRINTKLNEAPSFGKTIFQYDPLASGATAYHEFANEVISKMKKGK